MSKLIRHSLCDPISYLFLLPVRIQSFLECCYSVGIHYCLWKGIPDVYHSLVLQIYVTGPEKIPTMNVIRSAILRGRCISPSLSQRSLLKWQQSHSPILCAGLTTVHNTSDHTETVDASGFFSEMTAQGKHLEITWKDSTLSRYYSLWLRKNCHCPACRHDNGQLLLPSYSLPASLTVRSTKVHPLSGTLHIEWNEESHETVLPLPWLKDNSYSRQSLQETSRKQDVAVFKGPIKEHKFHDLLTETDDVNRFLRDLNEDGIALVKEVPCEVGHICKVAELVAPVQETLYGKTFTVEATEDAINVAYTPVALELHMDLVYFQSPPGLQLLHCLKFDEQVTGGESLFLDVMHVAQEMQRLHSDMFATLTRVPATFQKIHFERKTPAAFIYHRPHITVTPDGKISSVIWAPPFEGPLKVPEDDVEPYYEAYRKFSELINTSKLKVSHRLRPGECFVFNNLRILHARHAFALNGGRRHLEGCYVNIDDFKSRVQVMHMQTGSGEIVKRVNNGDYT
ncbi:probable gamma-butyrobetaine dioxygenase isoform X2 [Patiria miniata]|uniref:Gamma-butyrobetaine dioxygenase n=1 Tax=Patiria miniata TaxID=46514 RepID=A0A914BCH8_PATMI|nr:probable gamma-butyrobetaine dioxygenase isoform X2 [Patiria miniata]